MSVEEEARHADEEAALETLMAQSIGVPKDFFVDLGKESDWALVIKTHALVEASLNHLITTKLGDDRLVNFVSRLDISHNQTGKLALAKALDLIPQPLRVFIRQFSQVRNRFAHDVKNVNANLKDFIGSLDRGQRKAFMEGMKATFSSEFTMKIEGVEHKYTADEFVNVNPRLAILFNVADIVSLACTGKRLEHIMFAEEIAPPRSNPNQL